MKQAITSIVCITTLTLFLFSCTDKPKDKLIIGKWMFDHSEPSPKTSAEDAKKMDDGSKGVIAEFQASGNYFTLKDRIDGTDTIETGTYHVGPNGKELFTHASNMSRVDSVEITGLDNKFLKIKTPDKGDIIILKRLP